MKTNFLIAILSFLFVVASHAQVVFTLNKSSYAPGEAITATWSGRTTPNTTDWVGIYPRPIAGDPNGVPDGNPGSTIWKYTNGASSGSVTFTNPGLAVGNWTAYFLLNDGYSSPAKVQFTISTAARIAGFTADHTFINDGSPIALSWAIDSGSGSVQTLTLGDGITSTDVAELNVLEVSPTRNTTYTLTLNGTITAQAHVFKDSGNTNFFNLGDNTHISSNEEFVANWNGTGGANDSWVGIYKKGDIPGPVVSTYWNYLNGTKVAGGPVMPSGSLGFDPAPGEYWAFLFTDAGYTIEQGPIRFTVLENEIKPFEVTRFGTDSGDTRIDWNSLPNELYDVLTTTDFIDWQIEAENVRASAVSSSVFMAPTPADPSRFYQVRRKPPVAGGL